MFYNMPLGLFFTVFYLANLKKITNTEKYATKDGRHSEGIKGVSEERL